MHRILKNNAIFTHLSEGLVGMRYLASHGIINYLHPIRSKAHDERMVKI